MKTNWQTKSLNKIGKIFSGNSINAKLKKEKYLNIPKGVPYVATKDISYSHKINYNNGIKIPESDLKKFRVAHKNSILICAEGGSAGRKMAFNTQDVCFVNKLFVLEAFDFIDPKFAYYFYQTDEFKNQFKFRMTGIIGGVSMGKFKEIEISYPLIQEQKQIVKILDKAFWEILETRKNVERNLKNAKELFESYLEGLFSSPKENWNKKKLGEICEISSKLIDPRDSKYLNKYHVGGANIQSETGKLIKLKTSKEEKLISGKFLFDDSMILYSKIRPYLVKIARPSFEGLCSADIYPLVSIKSTLNKDFLYFLLYTKKFTNFAIKGSDRAGMPKVNRSHLFSYSCLIPPLPEQKVIVQKLDSLSKEIKELETIYDNKIKALDELKQTILKKAFNGELTK